MADTSTGRIVTDALTYAANGATGPSPASIAALSPTDQRRVLKRAGTARAVVTSTLRRGRS